VELIEKIGEGFDADPVKLDVLADGDVGDAVAVVSGEIGDGADLPGGEQTVGDADADHEERNGEAFAALAASDALAIALGVDAPGTEIGGEPLRRNGGVAAAGEFADFVEVQPGVLLAF